MHNVRPLEREEEAGKIQCTICDEDFMYKGQRDAHLKLCKRDTHKIRTLQATRAPEHIGMINRWLWDKPPVEPSIIAQQQDLQKQQLRQQQLLQQQRLAAAAAAAAVNNNNNNSRMYNNTTVHQQLIAQQARLKQTPFGVNSRDQLTQMMRNGTGNFSPAMIKAGKRRGFYEITHIYMFQQCTPK